MVGIKKIILVLLMIIGMSNLFAKDTDIRTLQFINMQVGETLTFSSKNILRGISYKVVRIYGGWIIRDSFADNNMYLTFIPYEDFMNEYKKLNGE